jgi:hypothetical protein
MFSGNVYHLSYFFLVAVLLFLLYILFFVALDRHFTHLAPVALYQHIEKELASRVLILKESHVGTILPSLWLCGLGLSSGDGE